MKINSITKILVSLSILTLVGCNWGTQSSAASTAEITSLKKTQLETAQKFDAQVSSLRIRFRRAMKTAMAATMRLSGSDESTTQVAYLNYKFIDLPKHSQIKAEGTVHFVDDWQGESAFGTMIEFGDGPLDPSYVLEVTMMNSDGKALATTQKFEVKVEFEDDEDEVKIGEVELVAMNVGNDWREQFINVDVDISLSNTKIAPPKVLINVMALSEKSAILKVEPTCDMTLSTGICLGKATVEGNAIGSAYLVEVIALDEDGNTLAKSSQEVIVKPVLTISDIEVKHLGKGIYEYTVEAKYTSSQQLNEKSDFQLSVENEEGSCSLTTELGLVSDDGSTITTTFLKRGGRGKHKKYKSKSGTLTINIYESGNNLVVPPASNETSTIDIAAELSKTDLKGYSNTLKEQNKNGIRPTCSGRGSCFYGKCF